MEDEVVVQVSNINKNNLSLKEEGDQQQYQESSEAIKRVEKWMDHEVKIIATGNRVIKGTFTCFDKQQNILLNYAYEEVLSPDDPTSSVRKELGVVFVPMKHVISCLVLERVPKSNQIKSTSN